MAGKWNLKEGWLIPNTTWKYHLYISITRGSQIPMVESSHCWSCESRDNCWAVLMFWHLSGCCWKTRGAGAVAVVAHFADKGQGTHHSHSSRLSLLFGSFIFLLGEWTQSEDCWENDLSVPTEAYPPSSESRLSRDWAPHRHTDTENLEALDGISQHPRHKQDHISYHQGCH